MIKTIDKVLSESSTPLGKLIQTAQLLSELNVHFQEWLNDPVLAQHCQIGSLENGLLTILADSSAYATKLRFMHQELLEKTKNLPNGEKIHTILVKVLPKGKK